MHFSSDVIVMGLPPKVNMLTSFWYSLWGLVSKNTTLWTLFAWHFASSNQPVLWYASSGSLICTTQM